MSLNVIPSRHRRLVTRLVSEPLTGLTLEGNQLSFKWDGRVHRSKVRSAKYVPMVGTWSPGSGAVTESKKVVLEEDRILLGVHETTEKYVNARYGLSWAVEAHYVATEGPEKQAARILRVNWGDYCWRVEFIWRKGLRNHLKRGG